MAKKTSVPVVEDEKPKHVGVHLPPVEDFVRVMSDTFQKEFNHDDFASD